MTAFNYINLIIEKESFVSIIESSRLDKIYIIKYVKNT